MCETNSKACSATATVSALTISFSTTVRIVDRFEHTGGVTWSVNPATEHLLHEHNVFVLMQIVLKGPTVYLHELQ